MWLVWLNIRSDVANCALPEIFRPPISAGDAELAQHLDHRTVELVVSVEAPAHITGHEAEVQVAEIVIDRGRSGRVAEYAPTRPIMRRETRVSRIGALSSS